MYILGGIFQRKRIFTPDSANTRPSTGLLREALFNICQTYIQNARFLDLYAGSGAIGLEALSRGASHTVFVENHPEALQCIKKNIANLDVEKNTRVFKNNVFAALKYLHESHEKFNIIYADPPFSEDPQEIKKLVELIDRSNLLDKEGFFFLESSSKLPPPAQLESLEIKVSKKYGRVALHQYQRKDFERHNNINSG